MSNFIQGIRELIKKGEATSHGPPIDPLPPLTSADIWDVEAELRIKLPSTLKSLYTEIGNGGFGPGFGFLPLLPTAEGQAGPFVVDCCKKMRASKNWDENVLPVVSWGCGILSCLDLPDLENSSVYRFEPNIPDGMTADFLHGWPYKGAGLIPEKLTFEKWLAEWLSGNTEELFHRMNRI